MANLLGKTNLGLQGVSYFSLLFPFINLWKIGNALQVINNGVNYFSSTPAGEALSPWGVYLDADGELINPLPANTTHLLRIYYAQPADGLPTGYPGRIGESWVLKWDGDPNLTVTIPLNNIVRVGARLTGTWSTDISNSTATFSNFSLTNPPRNIRLCPAAYEGLLDQGEIISPDYLAMVKRGSGISRFMDWQCTNNNRVNLTYAGLPTERFCNWGAATATPGVNGGMPVSVMARMANKAHAHPWVCIPNVLGIEKFGTVSGVSQTNPCVITCTGHNFINGDQVIPYRLGGMIKTATVTMTIATPCVVSWTGHGFAAGANVFFTGGALPTPLILGQSYYVIAAGLTADQFQISKTPGGAAINTSGTQSGTHTGTAQLNRNKFTVQNVIAGVSFELQDTDTTTFSAWTSLGWVMSPFSLSRMTAEGTPFFTYFRDNIIPALITRFEYGNELWNFFVFDAFHFLAAQAHNFLDGSNDQIFSGDNSSKMGGYLAAHFMKTARDAYGTSGRARWRGILATQTVNTGVTNDFITGVNRYITDIQPSLTINDLFDDGAVAGYFGGNLLNGTAKAVTIDIATSTFTANSHGYQDRRPVKFTTTDTLPTPLVVGTLYYVTNTATNTFNVSTTAGGTALVLGGSQAGTHTVTDASGDWYLDLINTSVSRFNSGLELTRYSYYQRILNEDALDGRWTGQPFCLTKAEAFMAAQKTIFNANGLGSTQYEGGCGSDIVGWVGNPNYNLILEFFPQGIFCPECASVHTTMYNDYVATGGTFPAKFVDVAPATRFGAFGAAQWVGNNSVIWEATCAFNDKIWCGRLR